MHYILSYSGCSRNFKYIIRVILEPKNYFALSKWSTSKTLIRAGNGLLLYLRWTYETKVQKPVQGSMSYERNARPVMHG